MEKARPPITPQQIDNLRAEARGARDAAYCPYSNFSVGAAALCSDGSIFRGCNVENASYGLTVCAERSAIFAAVSAGHIDIVAIALVSSAIKLARPCGACRQVIAEFSSAIAPITVISESLGGEHVVETLADLLPGQFTLL
ncbi:MAG: cytidine deaminase [Capsulimonadaceae bacterium]|nr:cytidine deaminase [Capsulimonadaceae bacterium]